VRRRACVYFTCIGYAIAATTLAAAASFAFRYEYAGGWGRAEPPEMVDYLMDLDVGPDGNVYLLHVGGDRDVYVQVLTPGGKRVRFFGGYEHGLGGGSSQGNIAVGPDGSVHVVGFAAEAVTKFPPERKFPQVWKWFESYFHRFDDVAVGPDGEVYAMDYGDTIERFTAEGERLEPWTTREPSEKRTGPGPIKAIAVGPAGRLYMAVEDECYVPIFEADATPAGEITWDEGVIGPALDVAVAADGAVYVTDGRIVCTFAKDGSVIATWVAVEEWDAHRRYVQGLAAGRGKAVCVGVDNVVKFFTREGALVGEIDATAPPPDCIYYPVGIAVSPKGVVYVADNYIDGISCFAADGEPLGSWGRRALSEGDSIEDIAWSPDGTVAVLFGKKAESMRAHVAFYDPRGEYLYEWPVIVEGERLRARGLAVAPDRTVYLATDGAASKVLRFADDGTYLGTFDVKVGPLADDTDYINDVTVGPAGTVYVTRTDYFGLMVYSADGDFVEERYVGELRDDRGAVALAVDHKGNVFLSSKHSIYRFNAAGDLAERFGGLESGLGGFQTISAMAVAPDGTLYAVDDGLKRVLYFRPVGKEE